MIAKTTTAFKRKFQGVVVSDKMQQTAVVLVSRYVKHPKYKKYQRLTKRYKAHNPENKAKTGDSVVIEECRPISKDKHFQILSITPANSGAEA